MGGFSRSEANISLLVTSFLAAFFAFGQAAPAAGADSAGPQAAELSAKSVVRQERVITDEDRYDATQWYFKARYLYEQRKNSAAARDAIFRACELDPENPEIYAYLRYLADKTKSNIPDKFQIKIPEYGGQSASARRWFTNGVEAFERRAFEEASFCFSKAAGYDIGERSIGDMINLTNREMLLIKMRDRFEGAETFAETLSKKQAEEEGSAPATGEVGVNLKTARWLVSEGKTFYDPDRFEEWYGFSRYIYYTRKDYRNAKLAIDAALLYNSSNETALKFKSEVESRIEESRLAEEKQKKEIAEAEERVRKMREEEERKKRTAPVREVVLGGDRKGGTAAAPEITGDFSLEDFMADTSPVAASGDTVEIVSKPKEVLTVREVDLANERVNEKPGRRGQIEEARAYAKRHAEAARSKFEAGKFQEALLEFEKVYLKVLSVDPLDIKALYNLVLIYKKMGEQKNSQETFLRLTSAVVETRSRYSGSAQIQAICAFVDCTIKTAIVNAALMAYNKKHYYPMNRSNFDVSKLRESGFLVMEEDEDRQVALALAENTFKPGTGRQVAYTITGLSCLKKGKYGIGPNGVVSCSVHGENSLILDNRELDRVEDNWNPWH